MSGEAHTAGAPAKHSPVVSWFELFYDLVVIAAVGLANDVFIDDPTVGTAIHAMGSMTSLAWVWFLTTLYNNMNPSRDVWRRLLMVIQMAAITIAGLSVDQSHGVDARGGLVAYGVALTIVGALNATGGRTKGGTRLPFVPIFLAAGICFVGAAFENRHARYVLLVALAVSIIPMLTTGYATWRHAPRLRLDHLTERLGLFVIIVLGEGFLQLVSALHHLESIPRGELIPIVFLLSFAVWWIYFDGTFGEHTNLHTVRWRLSLLGHLTLVFGITGTLDILVLLTAGEDRELGDELLTYFVFCMALVLVSFAILGFTVRQRLDVQGWSALACAGLIALVGLVLLPQDETSTLLVVALSAVVVIGNAIVAVVRGTQQVR